MELVGLALHESVVPVESPLERPVPERADSRGFSHWGEVPFADGPRSETVLAEYLSQRARRSGDPTAHIGEASVEVGQGPHTHRVVVATR